jgi:hypothetical protein
MVRSAAQFVQVKNWATSPLDEGFEVSLPISARDVLQPPLPGQTPVLGVKTVFDTIVVKFVGGPAVRKGQRSTSQ